MKITAFQRPTQHFFRISKSMLFVRIRLGGFSSIFDTKSLMDLPWHLYLIAAPYIFAEFFHFLKPRIYIGIMPEYLPAHKLLVYISGAVEIILGAALLFKETRKTAAYGIILMLVIFLLIHFYILSSKKAAAGMPKWILILRIPLQFFLMWWAWQYLQY